MFHYVYVLESKQTKNPYIGYCTDLQRRLKEHNEGKSRYTKKYTPWRLIHYEAYTNIKDARHREKYLKSNHGAQTLKRLLKEYYSAKRSRR